MEWKRSDFLCDYLNITNTHIRRAKRVWSKEIADTETFSNKPKTVIAKLLRYNDKEEILRRKDTNCNVYEDFLHETWFIRAKLWKKVKDLCKEEKYATMKYDKLYIS